MSLAWLDVPLAVACLAAGVLSLALLRTGRSAAAAHALMAFGMAAMFLPAADPLPRSVWLGAFCVVGLVAAVAVARSREAFGEGAHHLVGSAAMVFMLLVHHAAVGPAVEATGGGHHHGGGTGAGALPLLVALAALIFVAWFLADVLHGVTGARPVPAAGAVAGAGPRLRWDVAACPRMVMNVAMAVMLLGLT